MTTTPVTIAPELLQQQDKAEQLGHRAARAGANQQQVDAQKKQIKKVSQDFEALFTGMMLQSMRSTVAEDKVAGGGKAEETYRYLLDQEYAAQASKTSGNRGIAALVEQELLRRSGLPVNAAQRTGNEVQ